MSAKQSISTKSQGKAENLLLPFSLNLPLKTYQTLDRHVDSLNKVLPEPVKKSEVVRRITAKEVSMAEGNKLLNSRPVKVTKRTIVEKALMEYFEKHGIEVHTDAK